MAGLPVLLSWSSGKDSALTLHQLRADARYRVVALVTTVTEVYDRVSMHGVRREILRAQAAETGLPLYEAGIPATASNVAYEAAWADVLERARARHPEVRAVAFGDLFLSEVRAYRERMHAALGWDVLFPLWGLDTSALAARAIREGFRAIVCCVDTTQLAPERAGAEFDAVFLAGLPPEVDPCGERGEFHTCAYAGPVFARPLALRRGERVRRDGRFEYCDLRLRRAPPAMKRGA